MQTSDVINRIFEEEKRELDELKRMASNPRLLGIMRRIVEASNADDGTEPLPVRDMQRGNGAKPHSDVVPAQASMFGPTGLTKATLDVVKSFGATSFTIAMVVDRLNETGFTFTAKNPKVAVAGPLNSFKKRGWIKLSKHGYGSEPNMFKYVGTGEHTEAAEA